ncbi:hypothetical protein KZH41_22650 [Pseudomonas sp. YeP6b]|uniref:sulfatase-like hydrolase/transferase n=1 Tax=Pseudomonas sp. YeP6b TaxID=2861775 RepID=UPI0021DA9245|nr:sulfatase-like hydrolase/transferase [Pseudomonas sp. YeP6b]UXZ21265.1 hypothetical protein KZH41_22650 [Pseudomonas sp. YeP6b]
MGEQNKKIAVVAGVLPFVIFVVVPLAFYFGNVLEYVASFSSILLLLCTVAVGLFLLFFLLLLNVRKLPSVFNVLSGLLVGTAVAAWVQSQIFAWDFGPLDGRGVDWAKWDGHAQWELWAWGAILLVSVVLAFRSFKGVRLLAQGTIFLGILTLVSSGIVASLQRSDASGGDASNSAFTFSERNNKILVILDTFQSDVFLEISKRWPEEVEFLKGFTFYPDTAGGFPTTVASVPLIMTGEQYKNEIPIREWTRKTHEHKNIANFLGDHGFSVSLVTILPSTLEGTRYPAQPISTAGRIGWRAVLQNDLLVLDGGFFRALPTHWKPGFYSEGNWYFSRLSSDTNALPGIHGQDLSFLEAFEQQATVDLKTAGEFKFYHYAGAHWPLQLDEHLNYKAGMPEERESYIQQSRGVLTLLRRKLEKLKQLRVYDSAEIVVVGDHGSHYIVPNDMRASKLSNVDEIPDNVLASSRPLFLYKPADSLAVLAISEAPMQLRNIPCVFSRNSSEFGCDTTFGGHSQDSRTFFYYHWTKDYFDGSKDFMPPMYEYAVKGDIRDMASWSSNYRVYEEARHHDVPKIKEYKFGEYLSVGEEGGATGYFKRGWSYQEPGHRWSDGTVSYAAFNTDPLGKRGLTLKLYASSFLPPGTQFQNVDIIVNKTKIGSWQVSGLAWYEVEIPAAVVGTGELNVEFQFNAPARPCDVMESKDCRLLGISAQSLVIIEQGATH